MEKIDSHKVCPSCGYTGHDKYCSRCGHLLDVKRLTMKGLIQDVIHLFTKFEKGFGYTLKQLIIAPGHLQRSYIQGNRKKNQSPFSMFFICATIAAVARYWILIYIETHLHSINTTEANFFKEYMVLLYILLVPLYALILYFLFYKSGYNYTEMIVLLLYTLSIIFLASPVLFLLMIIWPYLDVMYVEFVIYVIYFVITLLNFFKNYPRWKVYLLSILVFALAFIINQVMEDLVMKLTS